jgi:TPR repeat protein
VASIVCTRSSVALGLALVLTALPGARASDPDIPRLQVDAARGSIKQQVELGAAYFAGRGVPQDEKRAAYWYEKAANAGDPGAQKQIGYFYEVGIGVRRDPAMAVRWYERAAAGGLISAKVNLGVAYLLGDGVRKDTGLAEELFRQAYKQGNGMAACYLGEMYMQGMGVTRDEGAGEHWYEAGAKLHDPRAEFQLANLLWHRQKNPDELKKAVKLLREATGAGMVPAMHQLGVILIKHPELAASAQEAPGVLKDAAEAGEWRASVALGLLSRDGLLGVAADEKTAYYHYRVAVLQGGDEALKLVAKDLDAISGRLGAEQTAAVDADAQAWYWKHHLALQFVNKDGPKWKEFPAYAVAKPDNGVHAGQLIPTDPTSGFMEAPARRLSD